MEKENDLVRIESEDGKTYDMLILKEFEYKNAKYAVLMETDSYDCNCDNEGSTTHVIQMRQLRRVLMMM